MKTFTAILLLSILLVGCKSQKDPSPTPKPNPNPTGSTALLSFSFNETSGQTLSETNTKASFNINGPSGSAERIAGVEGNSLRVNGFYGWATGSSSVAYPTSKVCVSGWIAPSAFPVQRKDLDPITENTNAAIFSNVNTSKSECQSITKRFNCVQG